MNTIIIEIMHIYLYSLSWFCHFDDDTYVNIPLLNKSLARFNPWKEKVYLGLKHPRRRNQTLEVGVIFKYHLCMVIITCVY